MVIRLVFRQLAHCVHVLLAAYVVTLMAIAGVQAFAAWKVDAPPVTNVIMSLEEFASPALFVVVPAAVISSFLFGPGAWFADRSAAWAVVGNGLVGAGVIGLLLSPSALMLPGGLIGCGAGWIGHARPQPGSARWWGAILLTALLATAAGWMLHPLSGRRW